MSITPFRRVAIPPEALESVWAAYDGIPEKEKKRVLKTLQKKEPETFRFLTKTAAFPRGAISEKILNRDFGFGEITDKFMRSYDGGSFGLKALFPYLFQSRTGPSSVILSELQSCGSHPEAETKLREKLAEEEADPAQLLGALYIRHCCNLSTIWNPQSHSPAAGVGEPASLPDGISAQEPDLTVSVAHRPSMNTPEDGPVRTLDHALARVARLTSLAKLAAPWSDAEWNEAIFASKEAVLEVRTEVERLSESAGVAMPEWDSREDLSRILGELSKIGDGRKKAETLIRFLKALAAEVRALKPIHKLPSKRGAQGRSKDDAAEEIAAASRMPSPIWPDSGPLEARPWLEWVIGQDGDGLETLIGDLCTAEYPATAALVSDLEGGFEFGEISEAEPQPFGSVLLDAGAGLPDNRPQSTEATDERESAAETLSPEASEAVQPTQGIHTTEPAGPARPSDAEDQSGQTGSEELSNPEPSELPLRRLTDIACTDELLDQGESKKGAEALQPATGAETVSGDEEFQERPLAPLQELAKAAGEAISSSGQELESEIEQVIWRLLERDERVLAFHIMRNSQASGLTRAFPVPSYVLEILALLPAYSSTSSELPDRVRLILQSEDFTGIFKESESRANRLRRLLIAASLIRASLFDPSSSAGSILEQIHLGNCPSLHTISIALADFGRKGVDINSTILSATLNSKGWKESDAEIAESVLRFLEEAPSRKMNYAPATWIWRHWFQDRDGWMRKIFLMASSSNRETLDALAHALENIDLTSEINRGWEVSNGRGQLVGTALESLRRLAYEALELVQRRLDHWNSGPHKERDYRHKVLEELATTVVRSLASAKLELEELATDASTFGQRIKIAVDLLVEELDIMGGVLQGSAAHVECGSVAEWLSGDLLRLETTESDSIVRQEDVRSSGIDEEWWEEQPPGKGLLERELGALRNRILTWPQALESSIDRGDHRAARWILDRFAQNDEFELAELEAAKAGRLEEIRARLRRELKSVEGELGSAYSKGWLTPQDHVRLLDLIHRRLSQLADRELRKDQPYHLWVRDISLIRHAVENAHREQLAAARMALQQLSDCEQEHKTRVEQVLSAGNVQLANEYIQQLVSGESIEHAEELGRDQFFFDLFGTKDKQGLFGPLQEQLSSPSFSPADAINDIQSNDTWCDIDISGLEQATRATSAAALQKWFGAQRLKKVDEKAVEVILKALEFPISHISQDKAHYLAHLAGEIPCPIPDFGSAVKSRIHVFVELQRTSVDDVAQHLDRLKIGSNPVILLWLRPIPLRSRRNFARLCRQKSLKVMMIDTILASYALTVQAQRLRALFECVLPFTNVSPYTTTGGMLPEEMFFGRRREMEAIETAGQAGTCFVFGGRQIGKTVLLRKVERDFPTHGRNNVALYLDLNFHAVGQTVAPDEIWKIIAEELSKKDATIFGKSVRAPQFTVAQFSKHITDWLGANVERRILLLLDEADRFLQADGDAGHGTNAAPFQICLKMKGLMDSTERRFKVVFAGLHNVQRSTRVANNPLAQLGIPVCVGPLHQNGESREAGRLISLPLAVGGVFFDSIDTINTILARTNYYPNLIQIFCARLLQTTRDRQSSSSPEQTPPYLASSEDVERLFSRHEIRDELRKKFMLTLDLDRRFSLIAHHMAFTASDMPNGFTVDDIQRDAIAWWPAGFEADRQRSNDSLREDLSVLLTEMCGLGILRRDSSDRFYLRSPNVVSLLGSPNDIEKVLEAAAEWEAAPPYSPESFRSPIETAGNFETWRSPLTARQETFLKDPQNSIVVISGCQAAGISEVPMRLKSRSVLGEEFTLLLPAETSKQQFEGSFDSLAKRESSGKTVIVVPAECEWEYPWVGYAGQRLGQFRNKNVGVVFIADPAKVWKVLPEWKAIAKEPGLSVMKLQRWDNAAVRQWLDDAGLPSEYLKWIHTATAGWHEAIRILGQHVRDGNPIESLVKSPENAESFFSKRMPLSDAFGFPAGIAPRVLQILGEFAEPITADVLHDFYGSELGPNESKKIAPTLEWAEAVDVAVNTQSGWQIDPVVGKLLTHPANTK